MKNNKFTVWIILLVVCIIFWIGLIFLFIKSANSSQLTASWYSEESCRREGTSGIMANGRKLDDKKYTVASWDYKFGTILEIKNTKNGQVVRAEVTDRGPNKRLYHNGRVVDLSVASFKAIANLKDGVIPVEITVVGIKDKK